MTDERGDDSVITTNAGLAGRGKNYFRGYSVPDDLAGQHGYWTLVSLAAGHRRMDRMEARYLDELTTAMNGSDPRILPLKFAWLAGSLGGSMSAMGALLVWLDGSRVGPSPATKAAEAWLALEGLEDPDAIEQWFAERKARRELVPGFGVQGREKDERVELAKHVVQAHGRRDGRYLRLFARVEAALERGRLRPNIVGLVTACALDLGFRPEHMPFVVWPGLEVSVIANAIDAAAQRPRVLQRLPSALVRYEGPAPRSSPRALSSDRDR
jgi:hypothetical protein